MSLFMDWLFLVFGGTLIFICAKRGLLLTFLKFFKMLLSVIAARLWGGAFGAFIGKTFLNAPIRNSVYRKVSEVYRNQTNGFTAESSLENLPKYLQTDAVREKLNGLEETGEALVESVTDTVSGAISSVVCGVLGFLLVFVFVFLALSIVYVLIQNAKKIFKAFGTADAILGGLLGFVFAWAVLLFFGSVMKFFFGNQSVYTDSAVVKFFGESTLADSLNFLDPEQWLRELLSSSL